MTMDTQFWALPKSIAKLNISDGAKLTYAVLFTRRNGDNLAFPKRMYIAEALGCSIYSVDKYIKQLKDAQVIEVRQRGLKKSNLYKFTTPDLPNLTTQESEDLTTPIVRDSSKNSLSKDKEREFIFQEEMKTLEESPRREMNIIAFYLQEKKVDLKNHAQLSAAIKRHVRAAIQLKPFTDTQITRAAREAQEQYGKLWTIETLIKILTR